MDAAQARENAWGGECVRHEDTTYFIKDPINQYPPAMSHIHASRCRVAGSRVAGPREVQREEREQAQGQRREGVKECEKKRRQVGSRDRAIDGAVLTYLATLGAA